MDQRPDWARSITVCALLLFAFFDPLTATAQTSGLAASWTFDEGAGTSTADVTGNANTGTLTGSPTWTSGSSGNALNFNNLDSYVNVPPATSINSLYASGAGMTVMARIKAASPGESTNGRIVKKSAVGAGYTFKTISGSKLQFVAEFSTSTLTLSSAAAVTLNSWQHVAVTWTGAAAAATAHIYINGTLSDGAAVDGVGTIGDDAPNPLTIGNQTDLTRGFDGAIDEVRLYNRVLTQSEIQAISSDGAAPSVPTALTATAVSSSQINLSWTASTDNVGVNGYLVERCAGAGCTNFTQIGTPSGTTFNDSGLAAATAYSYRIRAQDVAANFSAYSSTASATTAAAGDTQAPTAPSNLSATPASSTQINLSWTASTDNVGVTGYLLERCLGASCTNFAQIATPSGTTYNDPGLTPSTTYRYQVRATDAASNLSGYSNIASAATSAAPPAPTGLLVTAASSSEIDLAWTASAGATGYLLERCQGANCSTFAQIAAPALTVYNDAGRTASTSYSYRVRAQTASDLSGYSNTVTQITPASSPDCN